MHFVGSFLSIPVVFLVIYKNIFLVTILFIQIIVRKTSSEVITSFDQGENYQKQPVFFNVPYLKSALLWGGKLSVSQQLCIKWVPTSGQYPPLNTTENKRSEKAKESLSSTKNTETEERECGPRPQALWNFLKRSWPE